MAKRATSERAFGATFEFAERSGRALYRMIATRAALEEAQQRPPPAGRCQTRKADTVRADLEEAELDLVLVVDAISSSAYGYSRPRSKSPPT